jgi:hypothetical protein
VVELGPLRLAVRTGLCARARSPPDKVGRSPPADASEEESRRLDDGSFPAAADFPGLSPPRIAEMAETALATLATARNETCREAPGNLDPLSCRWTGPGARGDMRMPRRGVVDAVVADGVAGVVGGRGDNGDSGDTRSLRESSVAWSRLSGAGRNPFPPPPPPPPELRLGGAAAPDDALLRAGLILPGVCCSGAW